MFDHNNLLVLYVKEKINWIFDLFKYVQYQIGLVKCGIILKQINSNSHLSGYINIILIVFMQFDI